MCLIVRWVLLVLVGLRMVVMVCECVWGGSCKVWGRDMNSVVGGFLNFKFG